MISTVLPTSRASSPTEAFFRSNCAATPGSSKLPARAVRRADPDAVIAPREIVSRVPLISWRVASISPVNRSNPCPWISPLLTVTWPAKCGWSSGPVTDPSAVTLPLRSFSGISDGGLSSAMASAGSRSFRSVDRSRTCSILPSVPETSTRVAGVAKDDDPSATVPPA